MELTDTVDIIARVVEVVSFVAAAGVFIFNGGFHGGASIQRMEAAVSALKDHFISQGTAIKELQQDFKQITGVLTQLAVQDTRLNTMAETIRTLDERYEELRHGEGFIYPLGAYIKPPT